jgi:undecaprenyl-diphosphatase
MCERNRANISALTKVRETFARNQGAERPTPCARSGHRLCSHAVTQRVLRLPSTSWLAIGGALALSSAIAFLVLARVVAADATRELDIVVLQWLSGHRSQLLTSFFLAATFLGSWPFVSGATLALCVVGVVRGRRRPAATLAFAVLGIPLLVVLLKPLYARPRPDVVDHLDFVDSASFPSGHAIAGAIFFGTLALITARRAPHDTARLLITAGASMAIAMVGLSRMYLGVHYPSDVLGGVLVGTTWSLLVLLAARLTEARAPGSSGQESMGE